MKKTIAILSILFAACATFAQEAPDSVAADSVAAAPAAEQCTADSLLTKISRLEECIKNEQEQNKALRRQFIVLAVNFLYLPYDSYSINELALPAFKAVEGTDLFDKNRNIYDLLSNYREDLMSLSKFLKDTAEEGFYDFQNDFDGASEAVGKRYLAKLSTMPAYTRHQRYGDWQNTYTGKLFLSVEKELNKANAATPEQLKTLASAIDNLLAN